MHILIAVDGTFSATDYNVGGNRSYVRRFFDRFSGAAKSFFEGPGEGPGGIGGVMGTDVDDILEDSWQALSRTLRREGDTTGMKVSLVGHSRGGHIVTALAQRLVRARIGDFSPGLRGPFAVNDNPHYEVQFLGLYDSVDMSWNGGNTDTIPDGVRFYAHAMRSPTLGSRSSWGNTSSAIVCSTRHRTRFFNATHGAVGGAPPAACSSDLAIVSDQCNMDITAEANAAEGRRAHDFILDHARMAGLPI